MKNITFTYFLMICGSTLFSQKKDSLIFADSAKQVFVYKDKTTEIFKIKKTISKKEIKNIQYFKIYIYNNDAGQYFSNDNDLERFYQTLDKNLNHIIYDSFLSPVNKFDLNETEKYRNYCGKMFYYTHYKIRKVDTFFIIDTKSSHASEKINNSTDTIKQNFDKLLFIYGYTEVSIGGYDLRKIFVNENPTTLIFSKNGKMGFLNNPTILYDSIFYNRSIILKKDNLYSYYSISQTPKYKRLDEFKYGLAYFELPNGVVGYIDKTGKEYFKHKKRNTKK